MSYRPPPTNLPVRQPATSPPSYTAASQAPVSSSIAANSRSVTIAVIPEARPVYAISTQHRISRGERAVINMEWARKNFNSFDLKRILESEHGRHIFPSGHTVVIRAVDSRLVTGGFPDQADHAMYTVTAIHKIKTYVTLAGTFPTSYSNLKRVNDAIELKEGERCHILESTTDLIQGQVVAVFSFKKISLSVQDRFLNKKTVVDVLVKVMEYNNNLEVEYQLDRKLAHDDLR